MIWSAAGPGRGEWAYTTFTDLSQKPEVYELIKQDIERVNSTLPPGSRIKKFVNLYRELDPDEGELTRNRKLRRPILEERYHALIDSIYNDQIGSADRGSNQAPGWTDRNLKNTLNIKSGEEAVS